ncbi:MAG: hypothetical protein H7Z71_05310 [Moraxellaceae bacterium]|nr:hypothetical protein [Pseudobdellovibrionaceae bacterium]
MKKNRISKLVQDMAIILFLSAGIPALIGTILVAYQMKAHNELEAMQDERLHEQTVSQITMYLKSFKLSVDSLSKSSELIEFFMTPINFRQFTENRLIGLLDSLEMPYGFRFFVYDIEGNLIFRYPKNVVIQSDAKPNFESIVQLQILKWDDQNINSKSAVPKGRIKAELNKNELIQLFPTIAKISGNLVDDITIETKKPSLQKMQSIVIYLASVLIFIIISIFAGLRLAKKRVILPIKNLSSELVAKTLELNNAFSTNNSDENDELKILKNSFDVYVSELNRANESKFESEKEKAIVKVATQVAHDVRSPISALNLIISSLSEIEEEKRCILREATGRINDIANNLLSKTNGRDSVLNSELLANLLDSIISEKRFEHRLKSNVRIELDLHRSYGIFSIVDPSQFKRIISNLINNAVESIPAYGHVRVVIERDGELAKILISDNGTGMTNEVKRKIGTLKFSSKPDGNGLGFLHAQEMVKSWRGEISISSEVNLGTIISISLPIVPVPLWFASCVKISNNVLSIDDDNSIHEIWKQRIPSKNIQSLYGAEDLSNWLESNQTQNSTFLVDYEFSGRNYNGLDLIEKYGLEDSSILVTSRFDDLSVRERAVGMGVKMLPKSLTTWAPIIPILS